MLENNMVTGRDRYTEETIEPKVIGICGNEECKNKIYNTDEYFKIEIEDKIFCDEICLRDYLLDIGFLSKNDW